MFIIQSSLFDIQYSIFGIGDVHNSNFNVQMFTFNVHYSQFNVHLQFSVHCVQCSVFHSPVFTVQTQRSLFKCSNPMFKSSVLIQCSKFRVHNSVFNVQ